MISVSGADVPVLGPIPLGTFAPRIPAVPLAALTQVGALAVSLAILGAIDSLLTSLVADSLTATFHDSDRELIGQVSKYALYTHVSMQRHTPVT